MPHASCLGSTSEQLLISSSTRFLRDETRIKLEREGGVRVAQRDAVVVVVPRFSDLDWG